MPPILLSILLYILLSILLHSLPSSHHSYHPSSPSSLLSLSSPSPCLSLGGKDSLVSWHIALTQGLSPVLMYVADGNEEYEENWRLKEIVRTIGSGVHLGGFFVLMRYYNLSVDLYVLIIVF